MAQKNSRLKMKIRTALMMISRNLQNNNRARSLTQLRNKSEMQIKMALMTTSNKNNNSPIPKKLQRL